MSSRRPLAVMSAGALPEESAAVSIDAEPAVPRGASVLESQIADDFSQASANRTSEEEVCHKRSFDGIPISGEHCNRPVTADDRNVKLELRSTVTERLLDEWSPIGRRIWNCPGEESLDRFHRFVIVAAGNPWSRGSACRDAHLNGPIGNDGIVGVVAVSLVIDSRRTWHARVRACISRICAADGN